MTRYRPLPDDFHAISDGKTGHEIARHYGAGHETVSRWIKESGLHLHRMHHHACPADFSEVAPTMHQAALGRHYGVSSAVVGTWIRKTGIKPAQTPASRPPEKRQEKRRPPSDFLEVARGMTKHQLRVHYGTTWPIVNRWLAETGAAHKVSQTVYLPAKSIAQDCAKKEPWSIYTDARDTLRRHMPVFRCNERGGADHTGKFWRVGNVVCTPEELLERAERYRRAA